MEFKDVLGKVVRHRSYQVDNISGYFLILKEGINYNYHKKNS